MQKSATTPSLDAKICNSFLQLFRPSGLDAIAELGEIMDVYQTWIDEKKVETESISFEFESI